MRLHRRRTGKTLTRAGAATDRLVVLAAGIAEAEIVHRALGGGHHAESGEQRIGHGLGRFHVARHHRRRRLGIQHTAGRHQELQRLETAGIERDRLLHQAAEHVEHHRLGDRQRGVEIAALLRRGAAEIDARPPRLPIHLHPHHDRHAAIHLHPRRAVAEAPDHAAHRLRRLGLHLLHRAADPLHGFAADQRLQTLHPQLIRRHLSLQIREQLIGIARRPGPSRQALTPGLLQKHATLQQGHVVEQQPLLFDRAAVGRHRPRRDAAHIGVMAAGSHEGHQAIGSEHGGDHGEIRQMRATVEGVVGHHRIARRQRRQHTALHIPQQRQDALAHRSQMHRDMGGVGHQTASGVKQSAGEIQPLADVHRGAGLLQARAHLLGDRHEAMAEQRKADRIKVIVRLRLMGHGRD